MEVIFASGKRKTSSATVWLTPGKGEIYVNKKPLKKYFERESFIYDILKPLEIANLRDKFNIKVSVKGGGKSGQAGAVRLGIAKALVKFDSNLRKLLKDAGFLTRDPRMVERKKYGRPKARKRFQFSKR